MRVCLSSPWWTTRALKSLYANRWLPPHVTMLCIVELSCVEVSSYACMFELSLVVDTCVEVSLCKQVIHLTILCIVRWSLLVCICVWALPGGLHVRWSLHANVIHLTILFIVRWSLHANRWYTWQISLSCVEVSSYACVFELSLVVYTCVEVTPYPRRGISAGSFSLIMMKSVFSCE